MSGLPSRLLALLGLLAAAVALTLAAQAQAEPRTNLRAIATATAAVYLGIGEAELRAELRKGRSLAQLAARGGRSVEGLTRAILLRAARENDKPSLRARVERLVHHVFGARDSGRRLTLGPALYAAAARYLDLSVRELRLALRKRALGPAATAGHRSLEGLRQALLAAGRRRIEQLSPELSAKRRQKLLASLERRVERLVLRVRAA